MCIGCSHAVGMHWDAHGSALVEQRSYDTLGNQALCTHLFHAGSMQVLPVSLSVTSFHFFQLTELSTVFLHISWMASKIQVQYFYLFSVLIGLLITFGIRLATNAYIVFHVVTRLLELRLWEVSAPPFCQASLHCSPGSAPVWNQQQSQTCA